MIFLLYIIKGIILGCTAIIPGVSIGTMAIVLDVYDIAIHYFTILVTPTQWNKKHIYTLFMFFVPIGIGILLAFFALANLISWLLEHYPTFITFGFIGIIIGSLPFVYQNHIKQHFSWKLSPYVLLGIIVILFFAFSHSLFHISKSSTPAILIVSLQSFITAILFGAISSACGLIPGISGSFVLLILGYYHTYLTIIKTLNIPLAAALLIGHILGFIAISFAIKTMLNKFPAQSYGTILGMILASIVALFPINSLQEDFARIPNNQIIWYLLSSIVCVILGMLLSRVSMIKRKKV